MKTLQARLNNCNISLISNNCNGCIVLHDLGLQFNSQFVNLYLKADDYIRYLENFDYYNSLSPEFINREEQNGGGYPIGLLQDIKIFFVHYKTTQEALYKWNLRKKRIIKENLFVIFTDQGDCTYNHLKRFDALPFNNKVVFTSKYYPEIRSSFFVKSYENAPNGVYMFLDFKNHFSKHRKLDVFDWVSWFNGEIHIN